MQRKKNNKRFSWFILSDSFICYVEASIRLRIFFVCWIGHWNRRDFFLKYYSPFMYFFLWFCNSTNMYSAGGQIKIQVHYSIGKLYLVNSDVLWLFPRFKNSTIYLETRLQIEISVFPFLSGNFIVKLEKAWAMDFKTENFLFQSLFVKKKN